MRTRRRACVGRRNVGLTLDQPVTPGTPRRAQRMCTAVRVPSAEHSQGVKCRPCLAAGLAAAVVCLAALAFGDFGARMTEEGVAFLRRLCLAGSTPRRVPASPTARARTTSGVRSVAARSRTVKATARTTICTAHECYHQQVQYRVCVRAGVCIRAGWAHRRSARHCVEVGDMPAKRAGDCADRIHDARQCCKQESTWSTVMRCWPCSMHERCLRHARPAQAHATWVGSGTFRGRRGEAHAAVSSGASPHQFDRRHCCS